MARIDVRNWSARACARCDISHILRHFVLYRFRLSRKLPRPARPPPTDAPYPLVVFRCRREAHFIFNFFSPQHSKVSVSDEDDGSGGTCIAVLYCLRPPAPALGCLLSVRRTTLFVRGSGGRSSSLLIARIRPPLPIFCCIVALSNIQFIPPHPSLPSPPLLTISLLLTMPGWPTLLWMPQFRSTSVLRGILRSTVSQSIWRCGI